MLQRNTAQTAASAHVAHAAVVGMHALCCGLPALAMVLAALSGTASGALLASSGLGGLHTLLHAHELWIVIASGALVVLGASLEFKARAERGRDLPWLFLFSALCFVFNLAVIGLHRAV